MQSHFVGAAFPKKFGAQIFRVQKPWVTDGDDIFSGKNVFKLKHDINDIHVVCIHAVYIYDYIYMAPCSFWGTSKMKLLESNILLR